MSKGGTGIVITGAKMLIEIFVYGWNHSVISPHSTDHIVLCPLFANYPSAMAEESVETIKGMNL